MALNGNNIIATKLVGNDYVAIAGTRSNEIQTESEVIEISSPMQGEWRDFIAGRKAWSLTVNFLVLADSNLSDLLQVGNKFTLRIQNRSGTQYVSGDALLSVCKITSTRGNISQGTFQFRGCGELSVPTNSSVFS